MKFELIRVPSFWGTELNQKHISVQERNRKLVVLFPGRNYSCELPLLYYAGNTALQLDYDLLILEYGYQAARMSLDLNDLPKVIDECFESIKIIANNYDQVIFISKSLGTIIAGEVHRRLQVQINHIFLTPLVETIEFINTTNGIVIFGSKDPLFIVESVRQIESSQRIIEIPNADHGLETGNVEENLSILIFIVKTYKEILIDKACEDNSRDLV
ncbi:alpha/beta hydrolase [Paenibacillus sp. FA6]|uniref:alpha/beta hydrolase n=1 Tax=Paenibacillus sp. FA6 TaxID=3413029 RepID=UPI003F65D5B8